MDPRYTGEILRHLEKQDELLMDAYRSMSHEVHKLQVEEEMLMRKFFELMSPQCLNKKNQEDDTKVSDDSTKGQSSALITRKKKHATEETSDLLHRSDRLLLFHAIPLISLLHSHPEFHLSGDLERERERAMEKMMNVLKPKPNPQQQLRDWQRRLRQECRNIERQIRDIQREEKSVQKAIKEAAKRNDMGSAKALAKEIVRSRQTVNRLYENKAQLNSISMHLGESVAIARTVGHLSKSAEVMKLVNNLMKAPEVAITMQEFSKEMIKSGIIEETVNDAIDSALDSEDIEEEIEEEVDKVLTALAGETAAQLPEAVRKEKLKQPARVAGAELEDEAIAEGADDEEELEEIRARLARVRS